MSPHHYPAPPLSEDLLWRPATVKDAGSIAKLFDSCFDIDGGYRVTANELQTELEIPDGDAFRDTLIGITDGGEVVASAWVIVFAGAASTFRVFDWNNVHPDFRSRGIGSFLLAWWERRGKERAGASALPISYRQYPYDWQEDRIDLLEGHGYRPQRYFTELARDLASPIPDPTLPDGISIEPWTPEVSDKARQVSNAAFADHWGSEPLESERWEAQQDEFFDREASAVAVSGGEPVALIACAMYPHDFADRGRSEGWIERLGTLRNAHGRGIATALINHSLSCFQVRGIDFALLGADADNPTGAMSLYQRLGFVAEKQSIAYVKDVID